MRIVLISDTHDQYPQVPCGDILIHAGDLTMRGDAASIVKAGDWLRSLPHKHKVVIAGNHDFLFERNSGIALEYLGSGIYYLENTGMFLEGLMIWGSPVQPEFCNWAFNVERGEAIRKYWDKIPYDLDILITHGPPRGILDQTVPHRHTEHLGCDDLLMAVREKKPRVHVFGHIHGGYGKHVSPVTKTQFYNAALLNEMYVWANAPWIIDLEPK
jgi:predicted phosphohydrolase